MIGVDLDRSSVRDLNRRLHDLDPGAGNGEWRVTNPKGKHALAVGVRAAVDILIDGHVGYYCGGMNDGARITVAGHCGRGVGENIMSGVIRVKGNASEAAGASGHGGLVIVEGDAGARCGISMKGVDIVIGGSVGHMSAFMAQKGRLVVCGDADEDLGESIYEAVIYLRGEARGLGADCIEKEMTAAHLSALAGLLAAAGVEADAGDFRRYGSARKLYHFNVDHADAY